LLAALGFCSLPSAGIYPRQAARKRRVVPGAFDVALAGR
jgi:hypothetical protein